MPHYITTHNGHRPLGTLLTELPPHADMQLRRRTRCDDGSVNETYHCGCTIKYMRPPDGLVMTPRMPSKPTGTRRAAWMDELLQEDQEDGKA